MLAPSFLTVPASGLVCVTTPLPNSLTSVISRPALSFLFCKVSFASDTVILARSGTLTSLGVVSTRAAIIAASIRPIIPTIISPLGTLFFLLLPFSDSNPLSLLLLAGFLVTLWTSLVQRMKMEEEHSFYRTYLHY